MLEIKRFEFNPFGENTYIIWDSDTLEAAIIDPGMSSDAEDMVVDNFIAGKQLKLKATLLTHIHIDHTFGVDHIKNVYHAPVMAHAADEPLAQRRQEQARIFHLPISLEPLVIDRFISEGDVLTLGDNVVVTALHAPGHSPGSLLYYIKSADVLFSGDVLFRGSIGRTDLAGGSYPQLIASIHGKLLSLPYSTKVYPGHGDATTIADEVRKNPYF